MATEPIDVNLYTRVPQMDVPTAYTLGCALLGAAPKGEAMAELIRAEALGLRQSLIFLRDAWSASLKYGPGDRRAFDVVADASWRSLYFGLYSISLRSGTPEVDERAKLATMLIARLFADKLAFTQLTYLSQWAHSDRLIADIDAEPKPEDELTESLAVLIDRLLDESALAFVRRAHLAYGDALQITKPAEGAPGGVREPKRRVEVAIVDYVIALFAVHKPNRDDETNQLLAKALLPIDEVRAAQARKPPAAPAGPIVEPIDPGPSEPIGPVPDEPIPDVE